MRDSERVKERYIYTYISRPHTTARGLVQLLTFPALEEVRINMLPPTLRAEARAALLATGFPTTLPASMQTTPPAVLVESKWCNAPVHRRRKVRDGAVMRRL